jgi:2-hydroxychromene-2-carboxylate isomerase
MRTVAAQLGEATADAAAAGVQAVPAVRVGEEIFHGEAALSEAAAAMLGARL